MGATALPVQSPARPMHEFDYAGIREEVARAVRRGCAGELASQADDVAQEVLTRLLERHRRGELSEAREAAYWRRAAYHGVIDELRRRRRRREEALDDDPQRASPAMPSPERMAASSELAKAIEACLRGLTEGRRLAVFLHLQGHTHAETASILGWADKRAGSAIFRGLRDLRACLQEKGWAP